MEENFGGKWEEVKIFSIGKEVWNQKDEVRLMYTAWLLHNIFNDALSTPGFVDVLSDGINYGYG
jgi:hypothetical protein